MEEPQQSFVAPPIETGLAESEKYFLVEDGQEVEQIERGISSVLVVMLLILTQFLFRPA